MRSMAVRGQALAVVTCALALLACRASADSAEAGRWQFHLGEHQIDRLLHELSSEHRPEALAIENVTLLPMASEPVVEHATVVVQGGKIVAVGQAGEMAVPEDARRIDGAGRYLLPGLTDMHVHNLVSSSQHLLNLANGVTTVRDLDGFPWMLAVRDRIAGNELLAPNLYLSGHILNYRPMGMYATVVESSEAARQAVRQQEAAGYDFIKVHNSMPLDVYEAILGEARALEIDVVGHIPHRILVAQAVAAGQRTFEHFKGYLQDWDLQISPEDWVAATRGADVWNCPTFYTYREHLRGEEARRLVREADEMRYAPAWDKRRWLERANEEPSALHQGIRPKSEEIFRRLLPIGARFLSGTDSGGGYPFMVPGFALQEELRAIQAAGLSPYETLRTSTVHAAAAMRREHDFGTVEVGKRADLLLVEDNPLETVENLGSIAGVMVRGIWLDRDALDRILAGIEAIYNPEDGASTPPLPSRAQIEELVAGMEALRADGWVFREHDLDELAGLVGPDLAPRVNRLRVP